jgi:hypothetical protein
MGGIVLQGEIYAEGDREPNEPRIIEKRDEKARQARRCSRPRVAVPRPPRQEIDDCRTARLRPLRLEKQRRLWPIVKSDYHQFLSCDLEDLS